MRVLAIILILLPIGALADEFTSSSYRVLEPVLQPAGYSSSAGFQLWSTLAELGIGASSATSFNLGGGFLRFPWVSTPALSAAAGDAQVSLSWTTATGYLGWTVSGYSVGQSTSVGGPYSFSSVGNVTASTRTGLTNGTTYYFVVRALDSFGTSIATSTEVSATPASVGGGGGGGGGGALIVPGSAVVVFSGRAYPGSTVTLLRDSTIIASTQVGEDAAFQITVSGLGAGTYLFAVYGSDSSGNLSSTVTLPVVVSAGVTTNVSGIFISPTIDVDKSTVKRGNPLRIFGVTAPSAAVTITVNSENEVYLQTASDADGVYAYSFITSPLELGKHSTHSIAARAGEVSRQSRLVGFAVGTTDVPKDAEQTPVCGSRRGDLNCDGRVNLVDFSIAAFWYRKLGFPVAYDLNGDGTVSLVDFSIMAANWTG